MTYAFIVQVEVHFSVLWVYKGVIKGNYVIKIHLQIRIKDSTDSIKIVSEKFKWESGSHFFARKNFLNFDSILAALIRRHPFQKVISI